MNGTDTIPINCLSSENRGFGRILVRGSASWSFVEMYETRRHRLLGVPEQNNTSHQCVLFFGEIQDFGWVELRIGCRTSEVWACSILGLRLPSNVWARQLPWLLHWPRRILLLWRITIHMADVDWSRRLDLHGEEKWILWLIAEWWCLRQNPSRYILLVGHWLGRTEFRALTCLWDKQIFCELQPSDVVKDSRRIVPPGQRRMLCPDGKILSSTANFQSLLCMAH